MIKGIILDVDGVVVGEKKGYNYPLPHTNVINRLRTIESKGIPVSICTAKPYWAAKGIIEKADLKNLHITEGGAVIIDPLDNIVLKAHYIDKGMSVKVINSLLKENVYTEAYALDEYIIQNYNQPDLTRTHSDILQKEPKIVGSLQDEIASRDIVKIMPIANDEKDKSRIADIFKPFEDELTLSWGVHPVALPRQFGIITAKGISKKQAVNEIAKFSGIKSDELLGVGDSTTDWQFIEQCGYAAAVGNATLELKELVSSKGTNSFIGRPVDDNGVLDIFDYFNL